MSYTKHLREEQFERIEAALPGDALTNPIRFILTGGEASDYTRSLALLDGVKA